MSLFLTYFTITLNQSKEMLEGTVCTPVKKQKTVMFVKCTVDYYALREEVANLRSCCSFCITQQLVLLATKDVRSVLTR